MNRIIKIAEFAMFFFVVIGAGRVKADIPLGFSVSASTDAANYLPGAIERVGGAVSSTQNISNNAQLDLEIWGNAGKVAQTFFPLGLLANTSSSYSWATNAPAAAGSYTVKTGIFSPDWSKLYLWNDAAANFTVFTTSSSPIIKDAPLLANSTVGPRASDTLTESINSDQTILSNTVLDMEIYDLNGRKVMQNVVPVTLVANQTSTLTWNFMAPTSTGTYLIKAGVFTADWSRIYFWDDAMGILQVSATVSSPPPSAFVVSAFMSSTVFAPGMSTNEMTDITANGNLSNVLIDTEIDNPSGVMVLQKVTPANFIANQQFSAPWNLTLPSTPTGTYSMKVGIVSPDWKTLYFWKNGAFAFTIGGPSNSPQPGQAYPVSVLQPSNDSTVSGVVEIKAAIQGLDINTYTIGWRAGSFGPFIPLDTDPATQNFKHAWIDFSTWTWNANNIYPITFQATDQSNNTIGSSTISVTVPR